MGFYDPLIKDPTRNPTQQKRKKRERKTGSKDQTKNSTGHFRHQDLGNNNTLQFKHHFPIPLKKDLTPTQHNTTQHNAKLQLLSLSDSPETLFYSP